MKRLKRVVKYVFDVCTAGLLLLLLIPVFLVIAILIKLESSGPVFFRQERAGQFGQPFALYKFRSMVHHAEQLNKGAVIQLSSPLITRIGRFLRMTSLDELPQLINVLCGDMSLVGPRPLLVSTIRPEEAHRLDMKPGLTGLVQVKGRQSLSWDQRMALDLWYVEHWSFWLDLRILVQTLPVMFSRANVYDVDGEMKIRQ